ncbi:hypothetical protein 3 [Xinzhou nematode virus 4]|uniref:Uncharacterized protein n=1 Tax=Xinzhou nematode virus 4 TaxID=1923772 RepID=A0A1L3KNH6_9RHAB|nr:hypothetical protein 3 [Xinzhou nematode virus 4]APG78855.1 hypothetical protein 3 [Xinzhou nematode virus 4]
MLSKFKGSKKGKPGKENPPGSSRETSADVSVGWDTPPNLGIPTSASSQSPTVYSVESEQHHLLRLEVECHLVIRASKALTIKDLAGHINHLFDHYCGQMGLYDVSNILLCGSLSNVRAKATRIQSMPVEYSSDIVTVIELMTVGNKAPLLLNPAECSADWTSIGINHKTEWHFQAVMKLTTTPGVSLLKVAGSKFYNVVAFSSVPHTYNSVTGMLTLL